METKHEILSQSRSLSRILAALSLGFFEPSDLVQYERSHPLYVLEQSDCTRAERLFDKLRHFVASSSSLTCCLIKSLTRLQPVSSFTPHLTSAQLSKHGDR